MIYFADDQAEAMEGKKTKAVRSETVKALKERLKTSGLPVSGNKAELIARLAAAAASQPEARSLARSWRRGTMNEISTILPDSLASRGIGLGGSGSQRAPADFMHLLVCSLLSYAPFCTHSRY